MTRLNLDNNDIVPINLSVFSKFVNLEKLNIGTNYEERIKQGMYNRFYGSLEPLQGLTKLEKLSIENTDINDGLGHLPENLKRVACDGKLAEHLKDCSCSHEGYDYQTWRKDYLIKKLREESNKIKSLEQEVERLINLIKQQKEKIIDAYLHFFAEKELLKELITDYLEYKKSQKQKLDNVFKLRRQYNKVYDRLADKIGEEKMIEVEDILNNCEELIHYEVELQAQINQNQKLIADHQQVINHITYNIGNINIDKGHALISNTMSNNTDLSYQIQEVLETKMKISFKKQTEQNDSLVTSSKKREKRQLSISSITELSCEKKDKLNSKKSIAEVEDYAKEILENIYQLANKEIPVDLQELETNIEIPPKNNP
ncbi:12489_t:CDS:2 [Entrophospora sp. SA101]|nr:12489_t:CDS:2 [Entrophospora sp. SA101]